MVRTNRPHDLVLSVMLLRAPTYPRPCRRGNCNGDLNDHEDGVITGELESVADKDSSGEKTPDAAARIYQWVLIVGGIVAIFVTVLSIFRTTQSDSTRDATATASPPSASVETTTSVTATGRFAFPEDGEQLTSPFRARGSASLPQ